MIKISKKQIDSIINGELSSKDLAMMLVQEYSATDIAVAYVEELLSKQIEEPESIEKIVLSQHQFDTMFRIKQPNTKRGRPAKREE